MRVGRAARADAVRLAAAGPAVLMVVMAVRGAGRDAVCRGHEGAGETGRTGQPVHPGIEAEAIADDELRIAQRRDIRGARLEVMRIDIRTGDDTQRDAVAADLRNHVAQDGEGSDDRQATGLRDGGAGGEKGKKGATLHRDTQRDVIL